MSYDNPNPIRNIVEYLKRNLKKGYTIDSLKWALINQGYQKYQITKAIDIVNKELAESAPKLKEKPVIKHEIIDEDNHAIEIVYKKPWWKKFFGI